MERMLGDAAPRLDAGAKANGAANGKNSKATTPPKGAPTPGKAPAAKASGGRTTPQGSRSSQNRKKKRK